jgi:predicted ATPase
MGARYFEPFYLGLLAEALAGGGEVEVGLEVLAEALARGEVSGQKGNDAELHRLRGDLLRQRPEPNLNECEACFREALATAREQGTRGYELRAAVSLVRLCRDIDPKQSSTEGTRIDRVGWRGDDAWLHAGWRLCG